MIYDFGIVGGGIVGLATALAVGRRFPAARSVLLEKEHGWARHQTGRNSGVVHSGIYYKPGSLKAELATRGARSMLAFCREHGVAHEVCGKVIVATDTAELPALERIYQRGVANGVVVSKVGREQLRELEPRAAGIQAVHVPQAAIVDYKQVAAQLVRLLQDQGCELRLGCRVERILCSGGETVVESSTGSIKARRLINCAGLHSDRIARLGGADPQCRIVPFRGEYYTLRPDRTHLVRGLIYPVPNPDFPFLGVHFTRMINGEVHAGPNAVLALAREGYRKRDIRLSDVTETLTYAGFWRLAALHWRDGAMEVVRSFSKSAFLRSLRRLVPDVRMDDLVPAEAGVRAQALLRSGQMVDDFLIVPGPGGALHVCNAPSPAATASLEIGKHVAAQVAMLS